MTEKSIEPILNFTNRAATEVYVGRRCVTLLPSATWHIGEKSDTSSMAAQREGKPLRLAFIGGGINSAVGRVHFIASQLDNKFEVTGGLFSRKLEVQQKTEAYYQIINNKTIRSIDDLLDVRDDFDALVLLTPTPTHFEFLTRIVNAKVPVICEKSFVASLAESKIILSMVHDNPIPNVVTFNYSGYPMVRLMQQKILQGDIGVPVNLRISMPQEGFLKISPKTGKVNLPQDWRQRDGIIPTILLDLAVHCLHLGTFLTNQNPSQVFARFKHHSRISSVIDDVEVLAEYPSEMLGSFWFTKAALGKQNGLSVEVYGSEGSVSWLQETPNSLTFSNSYGETRILKFGQNLPIIDDSRYERFKPGHPSGFIEAFANLYWDAHDLLTSGRSNILDTDFVPSLRVAAKGIDVLDAMVKSNSYSKWQEVAYTNE